MNQTYYTIQLDSDMDPILLMALIDWGVKSMSRQLQEEAQKKKKFFGSFLHTYSWLTASRKNLRQIGGDIQRLGPTRFHRGTGQSG